MYIYEEIFIKFKGTLNTSMLSVPNNFVAPSSKFELGAFFLELYIILYPFLHQLLNVSNIFIKQ